MVLVVVSLSVSVHAMSILQAKEDKKLAESDESALV